MPITDDLAVIQCKVQTLALNRPIYLGFTVLELSKLHMHSFHYEHMKAKYPHSDQLKLLFTDTDSLAYAVRTDSIYEDMTVDAPDKYDFSEYPLVYPMYDTSNLKFFITSKRSLTPYPWRNLCDLDQNAMLSCALGKPARMLFNTQILSRKRLQKASKEN